MTPDEELQLDAVAATLSGDLAESPAHAMVHGMRLRRDEAQLTQVVAAIARSDFGFARAFAEALLAQAQLDGKGNQAAFDALGDLPAEVRCAAEITMYDEMGGSLGRVDLLFEDAAREPFTLVVENKLHSGFGPAQLERYQSALRLVRGGGGLVALTRDVPTAGGLEAGADEWLGSVRWARLLPLLRRLPIVDAGVAAQWLLLLDVLDQQGDLGMTSVDAEALRGWARHHAGRQQLQWLLEQVFDATLEHTRSELRRIHRPSKKAGEIANLWFKGSRRATLIQQTLGGAQFGISVPGTYTEQSLAIGVWMTDPGDLEFGVTVIPRDAADFLERDDLKLKQQVTRLAACGFEQYRSMGEWYRGHPGEGLLAAEDGPRHLLDAVKSDISSIIESGILGYDVKTPPPVRLRRKKGEPWGRSA